MAILANRVLVGTATAGTGTVTLGAAASGFFSFAEGGITNGQSVSYTIIDGADVEIGRGTYNATGPTLSRDTVLMSKIAGVAGTTKLSLSGAAQVFIGALKEDVDVDGATGKTTPVDADFLGLFDSAASNLLKKLTWANIKATLKAYFDGLYQPVSAALTALTTSFVPASASSSAYLDLHEDTDNGSHRVRVIAPASIASDKVATLPDATGNVVVDTATQTLTNKSLTDPAIVGTVTEDVYTITDGAGFAINPRNGSIQKVTLGANRTPTASGWIDGDSVTLLIDDGTARTITWSTIGVVWKGGTAPTLATSGYSEINITRENGVYRGVHVGDFAL